MTAQATTAEESRRSPVVVTYRMWLRATRDTIVCWQGEQEKPDGSNRHRGGNISRVQFDGIGYDGVYYCMLTLWRAAKAAADALGVVNPIPRTGRVTSLFTYALMPASPMQVWEREVVHNGRKLPEIFIWGYGRAGKELVAGKDGPAHVGLGEAPKPGILTHEGNTHNRIMSRTIPVSLPDAFIVFPMDDKMEKK